jgi:hypothetical protein
VKLGRLLALLFLLLPTVFALPHLGSDFRQFWNQSQWLGSNPYILNAGGMRIMAGYFQLSLDSLQIESQEPVSALTIRDSLGTSLQNERFEHAAQNAQKGREHLESARAHYSNAKLLHQNAFSISLASAGALSLSLSYPNLILAGMPEAIELKDYAEQYQSEWAGALSDYFASYAYYCESANQAFLALSDDRVELERAGLLSSDYRGVARQGAIDFISETSTRQAGGLDSTFSESASVANSQIIEYLLRAPHIAQFPDATFYWLVAGKNGSIPRAATLHAQYGALIALAHSEIENASLISSGKIGIAKKALLQAQDARSELVTPSAIAFFSDEGIEVSIEPLGPSAKLSYAQKLLSRAEAECSAAQSAFTSKKLHYISVSLDKYSDCFYIASQSASLAQAALEEAEDAEQNALHDAEKWILDATEEIGLQKKLQSTATSALLSASAELKKAKEEFEKAEIAASVGERFVHYSGAARLARKASELASSEGIASRSQELEASASINSLAHAISLAKQDGLDTFFAEQDLSLLKRLQSDATLDPSLGAQVAQANIESLLSAASLEYSDIPAKTAELESIAKYYASRLPSLGQKLESYSAYFVSGQAQPAALGKLAPARKDLLALSQKTNELAPAILGAEFSRNAIVEDRSDEQVIVGKSQPRKLLITTANSLPIAYDGEIEFLASLPFQPSDSDILDGDWISGARANGAQTAFIAHGAGANSMYSFSIEKETALLPIISESTEVQYADSEIAMVEKTVSFDAKNEIENAILELGAPSSSSIISIDSGRLGAASFANAGGIAISLHGISKGKHSIGVKYSIPFPFTIARESASTKQAASHMGLSYILSISNAKIMIPKASIALREPGAAKAVNYAVAPLSGSSARVFSKSENGEDLLVSLETGPITPGSGTKFAISYEIGSLGPLDETLGAEAAKTLKPQILSLYSKAHSLYSQGKFDEAYAQYLALDAEISGHLQEEEKKQEAASQLQAKRPAPQTNSSKIRLAYLASGFSDPALEKLLSLGATDAELERAYSSMLESKRSNISETLLQARLSLEGATLVQSHYSTEYSALGRSAKASMPKTPSQVKSDIAALEKRRGTLEKSLAKNISSSLETDSLLLLENSRALVLQLNSSLASLSNSAESSYSLADAALSKSSLRDGTQLREIKAVISEAKSKLDDGKFAESILLSRKALASISSLPPSQDSSLSIAMLAVSTLLLVMLGAWLLFGKGKNKQEGKRKMPKQGPDSPAST